jgi:hypothetical protein
MIVFGRGGTQSLPASRDEEIEAPSHDKTRNELRN